jgi:adenylate kinase
MLGAPGAGKGTQAKQLCETLGLPHISSGDLFRYNIRNKTELGELATSYINKGELVPDDVTIAMVKDALSDPEAEAGAVLDGFPRTAAQAQALDEMLSGMGRKLTLVPYIQVPEEELIARLTGRWMCPECARIYHSKFNPPKQAGICDVDGAELYQRDDDKIETVSNRIQVYLEQTAPLISYYQERGLLVEINGDQPIEQVHQDLLDSIPAANEL